MVYLNVPTIPVYAGGNSLGRLQTAPANGTGRSFRPATSAGPVFLTVTVAMLFVACLIGEVLERYLYFAGCASPSMPGGLS